MKKEDLITLASFAALAILGIGYGLGTKSKADSLCRKLEYKIDTVSDNVDIEIDKTIIDKAVDKAVKDRVSDYSTIIKDQVNTLMAKDVRDICYDMMPEIKDRLNDKVDEELHKIDKYKLERDIKEHASEKLKEEMDDKLEKVADKFESELSDVGKIYSAIAKKVSFTQN